MELRHQNRLQRELLDNQKIQFERYKTDFRIRNDSKGDLNKIKEVLEKKYQQREKVLVNQTEKIV